MSFLLILKSWAWTRWTVRGRLYIYGSILVLITLIALYRGCSKPIKPITLDTATVVKLNRANAAEKREEIKKQLNKNADVVKVTDGRTLASVTDKEERDRLIEEMTDDIEHRISQSKQKQGDVTAGELECLLVGEC